MKIKTLRKGIELFGKKKFYLWLITPSYGLGGKKPVEYTWELIYEELIRIEFGTLA
jgi:hypothetical protein